jgi:rhodanese-related sulfurtransferase
MPISIMDKVKAAKAVVPAISPAEAMNLLGHANAVFVDVRDGAEVAATGKVPGALTISRGMLEFRADTSLPSHHDSLSPEKTVVLYCASGGRAALAGVALQELGYTDVRNLGGFQGWVDAGGAVEK